MRECMAALWQNYFSQLRLATTKERFLFLSSLLSPPDRARRLSEQQVTPTFLRDQVVGASERYVRFWVYFFCFVFCIASWTGLVFGIRAFLSMF